RNGPAMICDTFQTLISYELLPEQRASDIEKQMQGDPVKEFRDGFGKECQGWAQARDAMMQMLKTGKGPDGRPVNWSKAQDMMPFLNAVADACANPNPNTVRRAIEVVTDRKIRTCKASNFYSKMQFKWNGVSQVGPGGPCGTVTISTLKQEKPLGVSVPGAF